METLVANMRIAENRSDSLKVYRIATTPEMVLKYLEEFDSDLMSHKNHRDLADPGNGETAFMN